jgi:hypothetical protein
VRHASSVLDTTFPLEDETISLLRILMIFSAFQRYWIFLSAKKKTQNIKKYSNFIHSFTLEFKNSISLFLKGSGNNRKGLGFRLKSGQGGKVSE